MKKNQQNFAQRQAKDRAEAEAARLAKRLANIQKVQDLSRLLYALADRDDFRAIVAGQAWVENAMILLVERYLRVPSALELSQKSYGLKLALAESFQEVQPTERGAFVALGVLRNRFAHGLDEKLDDSDAGSILGGLQDPKHHQIVDSMKSIIAFQVRERDHNERPLVLGPQPVSPIKPPLLEVQVTIRAAILHLYAMLYGSLQRATNKPPGELYLEALRSLEDDPPSMGPV